MHQTMLRSPTFLFELNTGQEGPRDDPYSFTEYRLIDSRKSLDITIHLGLAIWIKMDGVKMPGNRVDFQDSDSALSGFETLSGYRLNDLERWSSKRLSRCRKCGSKDFQGVNGYPGEELTICRECGTTVSSSFDVSVVM